MKLVEREDNHSLHSIANDGSLEQLVHEVITLASSPPPQGNIELSEYHNLILIVCKEKKAVPPRIALMAAIKKKGTE